MPMSKSEMRRVTAQKSPGVLYDDLVAMLRRLEWAGDIHGDTACPCCFAPKDIDLPANPERGYEFEPAGVHKTGCDLATLLRDLP